MRHWILIPIILLLSNLTFAELSTSYYRIYSIDEAVTITESLLLQREDVILLEKNLESWGWKQIHFLGITERALNPIIFIITPFAQQKLSTRSLVFHWEPIKRLTLRPDIEYYFNTRTVSPSFNMEYRF